VRGSPAVLDAREGDAAAGKRHPPDRPVPAARQGRLLRIIGDLVVDGEHGELLNAVGMRARLVERDDVGRGRPRQAHLLERCRGDRTGDGDEQQHRQQGRAALAGTDGRPPHRRPVPTRKSWRKLPCPSLATTSSTASGMELGSLGSQRWRHSPSSSR
jgi:hypothetical protein